MGSYHSWQIVDLVLLLNEFSFVNKTYPSTKNIFVFCRYIGNGFMFTEKTNLILIFGYDWKVFTVTLADESH